MSNASKKRQQSESFSEYNSVNVSQIGVTKRSTSKKSPAKALAPKLGKAFLKNFQTQLKVYEKPKPKLDVGPYSSVPKASSQKKIPVIKKKNIKTKDDDILKDFDISNAMY